MTQKDGQKDGRKEENDDVIDLNTTPANRRTFLKSGIAGLAVGVLGSSSQLQAQAHNQLGELRLARKAFHSEHQLKPLPFNSTKLTGLSARLIDSHWSNNYGGSVRALNATNKRLAAAMVEPGMPAFTYNDLKREHLMRTGSVILHELYFDNLGGGGQAHAAFRRLIGSAFGDFNHWETEYRRIAAGLGGGAGWVVLGYNRHFKTLENYWMADHMHFAATTVPLLVLDMYEHSYQMDYGAAAARYVDAFFRNINWDTVIARIEAISLGADTNG